jgi:hypothetical protein
MIKRILLITLLFLLIVSNIVFILLFINKNDEYSKYKEDFNELQKKYDKVIFELNIMNLDKDKFSNTTWEIIENKDYKIDPISGILSKIELFEKPYFTKLHSDKVKRIHMGIRYYIDNNKLIITGMEGYVSPFVFDIIDDNIIESYGKKYKRTK